MNRILVLNNVSKEGLRHLGEDYAISGGETDPNAIIVRSAKVDTDLYSSLVAVARAGAGVNNVSVAKATEKGICVFNTPGANANAVAELVFIMLGMYVRRVDKALDFAKTLGKIDDDDKKIDAEVEAGKSKFTGSELACKTIGVIGLGKIGVLVANAGIERGMRVIGYDAFPTFDNMHQLNSRVERVSSLEEVLAVADILSVHVPLSEKTRNLIGAPQIALMKSGCILMNYARNGIYDNAAVFKALDIHKVEVYITDFPNKALLQDGRVICTPHLGASTNESEENCALMAVRQLKNYLELGIVTNSVNFPMLEMSPSQGAVTRLAIVNKDVPNMIAVITGVLGQAGVNIKGMRNNGNDSIGYNLIDLGVDIGEDLVAKIREIPNVLKVRVLQLSK